MEAVGVVTVAAARGHTAKNQQIQESLAWDESLHAHASSEVALNVAKIRDACIHLYSAKQSTNRASFGFLPLVNFKLLWKINNYWGRIFDGDALITPQGRAEDIQLALAYQYTDPISFRIGYRILEGGTDSNRSYGFALLHYASLGC